MHAHNNNCVATVLAHPSGGAGTPALVTTVPGVGLSIHTIAPLFKAQIPPSCSCTCSNAVHRGWDRHKLQHSRVVAMFVNLFPTTDVMDNNLLGVVQHASAGCELHLHEHWSVLFMRLQCQSDLSAACLLSCSTTMVLNLS